MANSIWMIGEFFDVEARHYSVVLFLTGLTLLIIYYVFFFKKDKEKEKQYALSMDNK